MSHRQIVPPEARGSIVNRSRACASRSDCCHRLARRAVREDEAQITGALRQRNQQLIHLRRHHHVVHAVDQARLLGAGNAAIHAASGNRDHHDAGGARLARPAVGRLAQRVTQQQFLERDRSGRFLELGEPSADDDPRVEPQRAAAQAADRARRDFKDEHAADR